MHEYVDRIWSFLGHKLNSLIMVTEKLQGPLLETTGMALWRLRFLINTILGYWDTERKHGDYWRVKNGYSTYPHVSTKQQFSGCGSLGNKIPSLKNLLEIQMWNPHSRLTESRSQRWNPEISFYQSSDGVNTHSILRSSATDVSSIFHQNVLLYV